MDRGVMGQGGGTKQSGPWWCGSKRCWIRWSDVKPSGTEYGKAGRWLARWGAAGRDGSGWGGMGCGAAGWDEDGRGGAEGSGAMGGSRCPHYAWLLYGSAIIATQNGSWEEG